MRDDRHDRIEKQASQTSLRRIPKHTNRIHNFYLPPPHTHTKTHDTCTMKTYLGATLRDLPHNATLQCYNATRLAATRYMTPRCSQHPQRPPQQLAWRHQEDRRDTSSSYRSRGRATRQDHNTGRTRSSKSRSPRRRSPSFRVPKDDTEHEEGPLTACQTCLGRHPHRIRECRAPYLWDGKHKARCQRSNGKLIDNKGRQLCRNWNNTDGCKDSRARHIHECSGCGDTSHGAQACSLAQKTPPADPPRR